MSQWQDDCRQGSEFVFESGTTFQWGGSCLNGETNRKYGNEMAP